MAEYGAGAQVEHAAGADARLLSAHYDSAVEKALAQLPPRYRRLLELLTSDAGLTYVQIARVLGVSVGSIGPMRGRALELLRKELGPRANP
jgi:DNA-directed RNA polymerase specialized sigma24 family protein